MSSLTKRRPAQDDAILNNLIDQQQNTNSNRSKPNAASSSIIPILLICLLLPAGYYLYSYHSRPANTLFTLSELSATRPPRIYLAVMGEVFDVSAAPDTYGEGGSYSIFSGRDASRAYITGDFQNELHDDVADFTAEQFAGLVGWRDFYTNHAKYKKIGTLIGGRFYDLNGKPTALKMMAEERGAAHIAAEEAKKGPPGPALCNVGWSKAKGGYVSCSEKRYPRKVAVPNEQGSVQERCECYSTSDVTQGRQLYDGCDKEVHSCKTSEPTM